MPDENDLRSNQSLKLVKSEFCENFVLFTLFQFHIIHALEVVQPGKLQKDESEDDPKLWF
jgi:hypothetical protein